MEERTRGNYVIAGRETVAEGADLRVVVLTLAQGQCVPWHYHSTITDSFVCLEGRTTPRREHSGQSTTHPPTGMKS